MARNTLPCLAIIRVAAVVTLLLLSGACKSSACQEQLSSTFYENTCPNALTTIRKVIRTAIARERRMAASLLRLHFHDCFVQGCDASILLDNSSSFISEKYAPPNYNSVKGFEVIDQAKSALEKTCPGVVSCADILAVAARDATEYVGGPSWTVKLGRRDSTTASMDLATIQLPSFKYNVKELVSSFASKGLSARDMVALSGAHTIGLAHCSSFEYRINNPRSIIDAGFASRRRRGCRATSHNGTKEIFAPLDLVTPGSFDNNYFKNLLHKKGLLQSDQVLFSGGFTRSIVLEYSRNRSSFYSDFASAMINMGDIQPPIGSAGIIRRTCNRVN